MKKKTLFLALISLAMVGCTTTPATSASTSDSTSTSTTESTTPSTEISTEPSVNPSTDPSVDSSTEPEPSTEPSTSPVEEEYYIILPSGETRYSVEVTGGLTKATKGTTVSFTVTPADSSYAIAKVFVDSTEVTAVSGVYTITMPSHDIRITATVNVTSDVTLQGGVTAVLTEGADGIYSAEVEVATTSAFSYCIKGENGATVTLDSKSIDRTKCLADITFSSGSDYKLQIAGGAKYMFYYNPTAALPCYIKRTEVTTLPSTSSSLQSLFYGRILSENASYPDGVTKVEYTNSKTDVNYVWNKYNDDKSLATINSIKDSTAATKYVYKEIKDGIYTVVDTYDEANYGQEGSEIPTYVNGDTSAFAGKYKISDLKTSHGDNTATDLTSINYDQDFMSETIASFDVNHFSHDMEAIDFDIDYSYRVLMSVADEVTYAKCNIESTKNADGSFVTTITSDRVFDYTAVTSNSAYGLTDKFYDKFSVTIGFTKNGSLKSVDYTNTHFDSANYTLSNNVVTTTGSGTIAKTISCTYTYGEATDMLQAFDTAPYFISSINPVAKDSTVASGLDNQISVGTNLETLGAINDKVISLNYAPATALDAWQYHITDTSNSSVMGWDNTYRNYTCFGDGTADLTFSTFSTGAVSKTVTMTGVMGYKVREFDLIPIYPNETPNSETAYAYAGESINYTLYATIDSQQSNGASGNQIPPADITFTLSNNTTGLKVTYTRVGKYNSYVTFDATDVTLTTDIAMTMTINSACYGEGDGPTVISVVLFGLGATIDTIKGTSWSREADDDNPAAVINFTSDAATTADGYSAYTLESKPYKGTLVVNSVTYDFAYGFDTHTYWIPVTFKTSGVYGKIGYTNDSLGEVVQACVYKESVSAADGEWNASTTNILGDFYAGDEDEAASYYYADFDRVGA
ncbi:MAG: hypothetical protein WCR67_06485 [Bacilli bacterium]